MLKIAITGNIASGKSQVERILTDKGFKVADSDKINHHLLTDNQDVKDEIRKVFGDEIFSDNNIISKEKLGGIVFREPEKKKALEEILHKRIKNETEKFVEENKNEKFVFVSVPLLFEAKWENYFDKIIFVSADKKLRLKRLTERNGYDEAQALLRINSQQDEDEKIKHSDFIIYNNSDFENLEKAVENILSAL